MPTRASRWAGYADWRTYNRATCHPSNQPAIPVVAVLPDVKVISRTSVMQFESSQSAIPEIARRLDTILDVTLRDANSQPVPADPTHDGLSLGLIQATKFGRGWTQVREEVRDHPRPSFDLLWRLSRRTEMGWCHV
jgi:hypothetical protein